jgi:hypothetical protein
MLCTWLVIHQHVQIYHDFIAARDDTIQCHVRHPGQQFCKNLLCGGTSSAAKQEPEHDRSPDNVNDVYKPRIRDE